MPSPTTSLAVVPRERWSSSVSSLKAVLNDAPDGVDLAYIDGGAPTAIANELRRIVTEHGGVYVRRDHVLSPNEARNLAIEATSGDLIVFADNDIIPEPGWFDALVDCAVETGAGAVCPLIMHGARGSSPIVHHADGALAIDGDRIHTNTHDHAGGHIDNVPELQRCETTQMEFHSMLIRRAVFDDIGPFDEALWSMADHEDFALLATEAGWKIWFEPASVVTYLLFVPLTAEDRGFWQYRWSEEWNEKSLEHFAAKWNLRRDTDWVQQARWWSSQQRMWWWHKQGRVATTTGKAFRRLSSGPSRRATMARNLEERVFCTAGRVERKRREGALRG